MKNIHRKNDFETHSKFFGHLFGLTVYQSGSDDIDIMSSTFRYHMKEKKIK